MKSSFELALERTGGALNKISDEKKNKIAEIDALYKSKIAEAEIAAQQKLSKNHGNPEAENQIQQDLTVEIASIKSKWEREKEAVRTA